MACRFYGGGPIEKDILTRAYLRLIKHVNSIFKVRLDSLGRTAWNRKLIRTRPQIRIVYGMVSLRSTSSFFERGERWREKTDEDATTSQTEDFVVKYLWSAVGYCLIAIPTLGKKQDGLSIPQRTESKATYPGQRKTQGR